MAEGYLTPMQHAIMRVIWGSGRCGVSAGNIWKSISMDRTVGRTTVQKLLDRLEARGWVRRKPPSAGQKGAALRYFPNVGPRRAKASQLQQFVNDYYGGSAAELAKSLLKWKCLSLGDIGELKALIDERMTP